jgi:hypothetical protein
VEAKPLWRKREDALVVGAPLVVIPALVLVPVIRPAFSHARAIGIALLPVLAASEVVGLNRLALTLRRNFDVLTFFAAGTIFVFWVVMACACTLLGVVLSRP